MMMHIVFLRMLRMMMMMMHWVIIGRGHVGIAIVHHDVAAAVVPSHASAIASIFLIEMTGMLLLLLLLLL